MEAARGNITDRNGKVLVSSRSSYNLTFDASLLEKDEDANESLLRLLQLCQSRGINWVDSLPISRSAPFAYTIDSLDSAARSRFLTYLKDLDEAANALAALAFAIFLQLSAGSFADVGYYFDPTHPTEAMADAAATVGAQAPLLWLGAVAVGAIVPLAAAFMGRRSGNWRLWAPVAIIAALAGAVCMRVAFYNLGLSVFMFY